MTRRRSSRRKSRHVALMIPSAAVVLAAPRDIVGQGASLDLRDAGGQRRHDVLEGTAGVRGTCAPARHIRPRSARTVADTSDGERGRRWWRRRDRLDHLGRVRVRRVQERALLGAHRALWVGRVRARPSGAIDAKRCHVAFVVPSAAVILAAPRDIVGQGARRLDLRDAGGQRRHRLEVTDGVRGWVTSDVHRAARAVADGADRDVTEELLESTRRRFGNESARFDVARLRVKYWAS